MAGALRISRLVLPLLLLLISIGAGIRVDIADDTKAVAQEILVTQTDSAIARNATSLDDECKAVVSNSSARNSAWRRSQKCKCPVGLMITCSQTPQDCLDYGRYFKAEDLQDKGCSCAACPDGCGEVVENAVWRNSAWRRWMVRCKCEAGHQIYGEDPACDAEERKFDVREFRGKSCACMPVKNETVTEPITTTAAQTVAPTESTTAPTTTTTTAKLSKEKNNQNFAGRINARCGLALILIAAASATSQRAA